MTDLFGMPAPPDSPLCYELAARANLAPSFCMQTNDGFISALSGGDLGKLEHALQMSSDGPLIKQGSAAWSQLEIDLENYLERVSSVTTIDEPVDVQVVQLSRTGSIRFYQLVHGLRVDRNRLVKVNPETGRVVNLMPRLFSSAMAIPPSDDWLSQIDAAILATAAIKTQFGTAGAASVAEAGLYYREVDSLLRPQWKLDLRTNENERYLATVDALTRETSVRRIQMLIP